MLPNGWNENPKHEILIKSLKAQCIEMFEGNYEGSPRQGQHQGSCSSIGSPGAFLRV